MAYWHDIIILLTSTGVMLHINTPFVLCGHFLSNTTMQQMTTLENT